jgi:hypothetical protein
MLGTVWGSGGVIGGLEGGGESAGLLSGAGGLVFGSMTMAAPKAAINLLAYRIDYT